MSWRTDPDGPYIRTRSGVKFNLRNPRPQDVVTADILFALPAIYRYGAHSRYSVAQHSVVGAWIGDLLYPWQGVGNKVLIHDFAEAYVGDVTSPLKALVPEFSKICLRVERAIEERYGINYVDDERVKLIDRRLWASESRWIFPNNPEDVDEDLRPFTEFPTHWFVAWDEKMVHDLFRKEVYKRLRVTCLV